MFIAIKENKITRRPLLEAVASTQAVAEAIKVKDFTEGMYSDMSRVPAGK